MTSPESYKVLVVDDDRNIRELARRAMQRSGMRCEIAEDGADAWQKMATNRFDAVVTDLKMPKRNGHTLCMDMMKNDERPVVVVLTGVAEPKLAQDLRNRGVDDIHFKPVNYSDFALRIRNLVETRIDSVRLPGESRQEPSSDVTGAEGKGTDAQAEKKQCVAVMTADPSRAQNIARTLLSDNVSCEVPRGIDDLNDLMQTRSIDVLVIENELQGFLSGAEIVGKLSGPFKSPDVIMLTHQRELLHATPSESVVRMVLPTDQAPATIAEAVFSLLEEQQKRDQFIPRQARELVLRMGDVAPLPELVRKLLSYLQMDENSISMDSLAADIGTDSKSTVDLLKFTNCASNGLRHNVTDVLDAVKLNGPKRTISLLLSSSLVRTDPILARDSESDFRRWYTQRSVLIANTASTVAKRFEPISAESAYILGLLQDVGVLVLERHAARSYRTIRERVSTNGQADLTYLEQDEFQLTHAQVSAALMDAWGMQRSMIIPVLFHHDPDAWGDLSDENMAFIRVMQIGELLANVAILKHPTRLQKLNLHLSEFGTRDADACRACIAEAVSRTAESCRMFSVEPPNVQNLQSI